MLRDTDVTAAEDTYGPINNWDVSGITDMSYLFCELCNFNADISSWDTSGVTTMEYMFFVRALAPTSNREPFPGCRAVAPAHRPLTSRPGPRPRLVSPPCDSAGRGCLQLAAERRHVQGHNHGGHVLCACPRPDDLQPKALPCNAAFAPAPA